MDSQETRHACKTALQFVTFISSQSASLFTVHSPIARSELCYVICYRRCFTLKAFNCAKRRMAFIVKQLKETQWLTVIILDTKQDNGYFQLFSLCQWIFNFCRWMKSCRWKAAHLQLLSKVTNQFAWLHCKRVHSCESSCSMSVCCTIVWHLLLPG